MNPHSGSTDDPTAGQGRALDILLEDGPLLAVNKPAGLLTEGASTGVPTLVGMVKDYVRGKYAKPGNVYLGIPHRLDRPVSGVIVFARNSKAAARLAEQFHDRQVRKVYWSVVAGLPDPPAGELRDSLLKLPEEARTEIVPAGTPGARECVLSYRTLADLEGRALLEIEPATGRMHQIRAQLAARGWPIVGDAKYGSNDPFPLADPADVRDGAIALHARSLTVLHPIRYEPVTITAPPAPTWRAFGAADADFVG